MKKRLQDLTTDERYVLQQVCRHQTIVKLLADIAADITVCELEGWDKMEYIKQLREMLNTFN